MARRNDPISDFCCKIAVIFILIPMGLYEFYNKHPDLFINIFLLLVVLFIVVSILIFIRNKVSDKNKSSRNKNLAVLARKLKTEIKPYFSKPIKDNYDMLCFKYKENAVFTNVIEELDDKNGDVYIGELEWTTSMPKNDSKGMGNDFNDRKTKHYTTMCVLYDYGFNMPNFELTPETLSTKIFEALQLKGTEDIDFDNDKEFSDKWWLCSTENILVKDLFTSNIRFNFMKYLPKNYLISGQGNIIVIITEEAVDPINYYSIIKDIRSIRGFLKNNKKFYKEDKTRTDKDSSSNKTNKDENDNDDVTDFLKPRKK